MSPTPEEFYGLHHRRAGDQKTLTRLLTRGLLFALIMILISLYGDALVCVRVKALCNQTAGALLCS